MVITLKVQNSLAIPVTVRTPFSSNQPLEANRALEITLNYEPSMGDLLVVIEPEEKA